jgi:ApaG protein
MLLTETTRGIRISVLTDYQKDHSRPLENRYIFAYKISIENTGEYTIQLLRRHWIIADSNGAQHEVEGEGVVGQQPVIAPGTTYEYVSWANIHSDMGKMQGKYLVERQIDGELFEVNIPAFMLVAPFKLN